LGEAVELDGAVLRPGQTVPSDGMQCCTGGQASR
jgi:hypothetical protein